MFKRAPPPAKETDDELRFAARVVAALFACGALYIVIGSGNPF